MIFSEALGDSGSETFGEIWSGSGMIAWSGIDLTWNGSRIDAAWNGSGVWNGSGMVLAWSGSLSGTRGILSEIETQGETRAGLVGNEAVLVCGLEQESNGFFLE